jgi:F-type H+-transporting ATPase subunit delta
MSMKATRLYAQVLVDVVMAPHSGFKLESILTELTAFNQSTHEAPIFDQVFDNPTLSDEDKQKALAILAVNLSPLSARFLSLLARRNRLSLLPEILKQVEVLEIEKQGGLTGELVSAIPLEAGVVAGIQEALAKRLQKPVQLKQKVDASLIAGMRVTVSGVTYDGSVRGKLDKLSAGPTGSV